MKIVRPPPEIIAARRREVARRYHRLEIAKRKGKQPLAFAAFRLAELTRLIERRHGRQLPDTDDAIVYVRVVLDHLAKLRNPEGRMTRWLEQYAPWLELRSRERTIRDALDHPLRYSADTLADKLNVTKLERQALRLCTIGAIDYRKADRQAAAKIKRRNQQRIRRQQRRIAKQQHARITGEATYISE
jgi:hypothetical protein